MPTTKRILTFDKAKMKTFQSINVINQSTLLHAYRQFAVVTDKKLDMYILKFTLSRIYACQLRSDKCHTVYSFHCTEGTRPTPNTAHRRGTGSNLDRSRTDVFTAANILQLGNIRFVTVLSDTFIINIASPILIL